MGMTNTQGGLGNLLMGGTQNLGNIELLEPNQRQLLQSLTSPQATGGIQQALQNLLALDPEARKQLFQESIVAPTLETYQQQVLPSIQQYYSDLGLGSSGALNQALAQSATSLGTQLGAQQMDFYKTQQAGALGALGQLGGLSTTPTQAPMIQRQEGILGALLGAGGQLGSAYLGANALKNLSGQLTSSETVKENIRPYGKGLDVLKTLMVQKYDYKPEAGGQKNKIGLIAEDVPSDFQADVNGILGVDLYSLIGLLINSVKDLSHEVEVLREKIYEQF